MSKRPLAVAVVVLAGLSWFVWTTDDEPASDPDAPATTRLFEGVAPSDVTGLTLGPEGKGVQLLKDGDAWVLAGSPPKPAEGALAELAVRSLVEADSLRQLSDAGDPSSYGIGPAAPTASATLADGRVLNLRLGDSPPVGGGRYALVDGAVHLVEPAAMTPLLRDPLDYRDRRVLPLDRDGVDQLSLRCDEATLVLTRGDGDWWIEGEPAYRAAPPKVAELLLDLVDLQARAYGGELIEAPRCVVRLAGPAGEASLILGPEDDRGRMPVLAEGELLPPPLRGEAAWIDAARLGALDPTVDAWRAVELLDFNPFLANRIEWEAAGVTWTFAKQDGWSRAVGDGAPEPVDEAPVLALLQSLDRIESAGYPDLAAAEDAVEVAGIRITQTSGRDVAITLLRGASRDFARIEGEPALREVAADLGELIGSHRLEPAP